MAGNSEGREALGKKLRDALDKAAAEFRYAIRQMQEIAENADGLQQLRDATTLRDQAFVSYQNAIRELDEFMASEASPKSEPRASSEPRPIAADWHSPNVPTLTTIASGCNECQRLWREYKNATVQYSGLNGKVRVAQMDAGPENIAALKRAMEDALVQRDRAREALLKHESSHKEERAD